MAKIPAVFSSWAVELSEGKKEAEKYRAKAEYVYQSYHSTRLPTEPPKMAVSLRFEMEVKGAKRLVSESTGRKIRGFRQI